ncbi:MAG TPA: hypothetical protein VMV71_03900, partial [Candidatus Paceibacterota bacterium]|nr:hypothetical protein [Candidatus Paceibacterota bacterium]
NTTIIGIVLALIVGVAIGYFGAGYEYSAQLNKAKEAFPPIPVMNSVSGTIQSISGNTITLQTPLSGNPFENLPTVRQITVTDSTKLVKSEPVDPKAFQREMAAYQTAVQKAQKAPVSSSSTVPSMANMPTPPQLFTETAISISDLKAGDSITVDAGKDITTSTSFDAVKITLGSPAGIGMPPPPTGVNQGTAPMVNTPQVRTDGGVPPQ